MGLAAGSVAVVADAVNNLSDMGGGGVTLMGFRMADKPADREHPYGHERMECVSAIVLAVALLIIFCCTPILARGVFKAVLTVVFILAALAFAVAGI